MAPDPSVTLRVVNPYPQDRIRGDCRLHPETMAELDLDPGDVVEVVHDLGVVGAYAYPAEDDWKPTRDVARESIGIRLGTRLPGASSNFTGEVVEVRKIVPAAAERVVYEGLPDETAPEAAAVLTRENLLGTLASAGARMAVYGQKGAGVQGFSPRVLQTEPDGVVVVTEETNLEERAFGREREFEAT